MALNSLSFRHCKHLQLHGYTLTQCSLISSCCKRIVPSSNYQISMQEQPKTRAGAIASFPNVSPLTISQNERRVLGRYIHTAYCFECAPRNHCRHSNVLHEQRILVACQTHSASFVLCSIWIIVSMIERHDEDDHENDPL